MDGREVERVQDVQRGGGGVYSTEFQCVVYRIDECDGIVRQDDNVIQIMFGRCIDLGAKEELFRGERFEGGGGGNTSSLRG